MKRRDFIKILPLPLLFASSCRKQDAKFAPAIIDALPGDPGEIQYARTAFFDGNTVREAIAIMIDGRPVRLYGQEGSSKQLESSIFELYDNNRIIDPEINGKKSTLSEAMKQSISLINKALSNISSIRLLIADNASPELQNIMLIIKQMYENTVFDKTGNDALTISNIDNYKNSISGYNQKINISYKAENITIPQSHQLEEVSDFYTDGEVIISQRLVKKINKESISIGNFLLQCFDISSSENYESYLIELYSDNARPGSSFEYNYVNHKILQIPREAENAILQEINMLHPDNLAKGSSLFQKIRLNAQTLTGHGFTPANTKIYDSLNYQYIGKHWAMIIDIDKCTGCGACIAACMIENNIPPVGTKEVEAGRDMHWIRIEKFMGKYIPIMCQHCDVAPCESVCPVSATSHSSEGINEMTYNRCVGTRYCMAACPYNVRRFNYDDYWSRLSVNKLMHNPYVTKRMRGLVEKCTFCVHRLAGNDDPKTACQEACPEQAIFFGNINDTDSTVYRMANSGRAMWLPGGDKTAPSVFYYSEDFDKLING